MFSTQGLVGQKSLPHFGLSTFRGVVTIATPQLIALPVSWVVPGMTFSITTIVLLKSMSH
jgi:hypothetical protein